MYFISRIVYNSERMQTNTTQLEWRYLGISVVNGLLRQQHFQDYLCSYDFCLIDFKNPSKELRLNGVDLLNREDVFGFFKNTDVKFNSADYVAFILDEEARILSNEIDYLGICDAPKEIVQAMNREYIRACGAFGRILSRCELSYNSGYIWHNLVTSEEHELSIFIPAVLYIQYILHTTPLSLVDDTGTITVPAGYGKIQKYKAQNKVKLVKILLAGNNFWKERG